MNRLKSLGILFYFFFFFKCTEGSIHTTQHLNLYLRDLSVTEFSSGVHANLNTGLNNNNNYYYLAKEENRQYSEIIYPTVRQSTPCF